MDSWPPDPRVGAALVARAIIALANAFSAWVELRDACAAATLAELRDACAAANEDFGNRIRLRRDLVPQKNGALASIKAVTFCGK